MGNNSCVKTGAWYHSAITYGPKLGHNYPYRRAGLSHKELGSSRSFPMIMWLSFKTVALGGPLSDSLLSVFVSAWFFSLSLFTVWTISLRNLKYMELPIKAGKYTCKESSMTCLQLEAWQHSCYPLAALTHYNPPMHLPNHSQSIMCAYIVFLSQIATATVICTYNSHYKAVSFRSHPTCKAIPKVLKSLNWLQSISFFRNSLTTYSSACLPGCQPLYLIHGMECHMLWSKIRISSGTMLITYPVLHIQPHAVLHLQRLTGLQRKISEKNNQDMYPHTGSACINIA